MPAKKTKTAAKTGKGLVDQRLVKALGHPLRTRALAILNERVASPNEIATEIGAGLSQVSYHVKVLCECGYAELVKTEPRRGAVKHYYRGVRRALVPDDASQELPVQIREGISGGIVNEIFGDAVDAMRTGAFDARKNRHASWTPLVVDDDGWDDLVALLEETLNRAFDIQAASYDRLAGTDEGSFPVSVAMLGFERSQ